MRWQGREGSKNVEDRRGLNRPAMIGGGGLLVIIIGAIIAFLNNKPPMQIAEQVGRQLQQTQAQGATGSSEVLKQQQAESEAFSRVVLKDTEDVWNRLFPEMFGKPYQEPVLVFFDGNVSTQGCGTASTAVGPFYCPGDMKVYLDLSFFEEMRTKFNAPGDFACAYVIAHEIGHHVQNLVGLSIQAQRAQQQASKVEANRLSVRMELQADFLAGVWARHAQEMKQMLEEGDLGEAIRAAQQIGDDTIQRNSMGRVVPDAFTHGTSEQRIRWFTKGIESNDVSQDAALPLTLPYEQL